MPRLVIHAETSRQFDMARGAAVVTNTDFVGLKQNYGAGSVCAAPQVFDLLSVVIAST